MRPLGSLRTRLLGIGVLVVLPLVAITASSLADARRARREAAGDVVLSIVDQARALQRRELDGATRYLEALARIPAVREGNAAACGAALAEYERVVPEVWAVTRVGADGRIDCTSSESQSIGGDMSATPAFLRMRGERGPWQGRLVRSADSGTLLAPVNLPLRDANGRFLGGLAVGVRVGWLDDLAGQLRERFGDPVVTISAADGTVLARVPWNEAVGTRQPSHPVAVAQRDLGRGRIDARGLDAVDRVWGFDRLPAGDSAQAAFVSVGIARSEVYADVETSVTRAAGFVVAVIALAILLGWWVLDRSVLRDVTALVRATERLGAGDLAARVGDGGGSDELQRLGAAFDTMAARLAERQARELQAQRLEAVGQLAGGVAHDFNNLLTAIIGHVESAAEQLPRDAAVQGDLEGALDASRRSAALTRQLLAFARRPALGARVERLEQLTAGLAPLLRRLAGDAVRVALDVHDAPHPVTVVAPAVEQALVNLVVNARDAMPSGGDVSVTVARREVVAGDAVARRGVAPGTWSEVTVRDTGAGMDAATAQRAFEPFFTTKPVGEGTGLGLAMVFATMQQAGGHVWIESAPGRGTTVHLLFPPSAEAPDDTPATADRAARETPQTGTLLIVEDERAVRTVMARALRAAGYTVHEAADGAAARRWVDGVPMGTAVRLDAVVTDVVMPGLDGPSLVARLRERQPSLPALLVSGFPGTSDVEALLATPHSRFLEKPFTAATLVAAVDALIAEVRGGA